MRLLFMKHALVWPRSSGHDVHTYYMMKACAELGHDVSLATVVEPDAKALAGLRLVATTTLDGTQTAPLTEQIGATKFQERFRNYWGVPDAQIVALRQAARDVRAEAVIVGGLDALPYLPALSGVTRVWYAADEWVLHHLSQLRPGSHTITSDIRAAVVKGLYERAHRQVVDRAWVVSDADRSAMRWVAGINHVDVLPNGVDGEFFKPGDDRPAERTAVFWGRLDFGPNIQALEWFCRRVWPLVRRRVPEARFTIIGFQPVDVVRALATMDGVDLEPNLPDLRTAARQHALAVLPFVSGAGIKNKLLEAAAMGLPIVCTPKTARGLRGRPPLVVESSPDRFAAAMVSLWGDPQRRRQLAVDGRAWVLEHHTWASVAREAVANLPGERMPDGQSAR